MKKIILTTVIFFSIIATAFAQRNANSVAYQLQRKKINAMLARRVARFGDYDRSLSKHTGIFGLQTKKDIRRSNDILMSIVRNDDSIYRQIKILLDFRTFEQQQVQTKSNQVESSELGYMSTINKLRNQMDKLKAEAAEQQADYDEMKRNLIIVIIVAGLLLLLAIRGITKPKAQPKPKPKLKKRS